MTSNVFAGVDVGGGGIRVRICRDGVSNQASIAAPLPRNAGDIDIEVLAVRIGELLRKAGRPLDATRYERVGIGLTGMPDLVKDPIQVPQLFEQILPTKTAIIAHDALTTHLGALGGKPGTIVAAGTGVIGFATDFDDHWARTDGWGILLGDHGGGAWIGREGFQAALRAHDGRTGGSSSLLALTIDRFGSVSNFERQVYHAPCPPSGLFASFAPAVAEAAHAHDPIAIDIWVKAGKQLAETTIGAFNASQGVSHDVSWGGRLFDVGNLIHEPFQTRVLESIPGARFLPPEGSSVDGALTMAKDFKFGSHPPHLFCSGF